MNKIQKKKLEVYQIHVTPNAEHILSFAKDTRLMGDLDLEDEKTGYKPSIYEKVYNRSSDEVMKNVKYSLNTIRGPLEFVHFIFLINNASRALQQQVTRHRVNSYAIQSLRVSDNVGYYQPPGIKGGTAEGDLYEAHIINSRETYDTLVDLYGIEAQDARGVFPLHVTSAILMKINLRALLEFFEIRLCLRIQGEHRDLANKMADITCKAFPWVIDHIGPLCAVKGICAFPRYDCPISKAVPELKGLHQDQIDKIKKMLAGFGSKGLSIGTQNKRPECYGHYREQYKCDAEKARGCGVSPDCQAETNFIKEQEK